MFGRNTDRDDPRHRNAPSIAPAGMREAVTVPVATSGTWDPSRGFDDPRGSELPDRADESVIGLHDRFEGTLTSERGVRVLGTLDGRIGSARYVYLDEGSAVAADVTADEVVVAGRYTGKLVCRQRLEIRATGRVHGSIETVKLMLHEGGYIDGELHMQKPDVAGGSPDVRPQVAGPGVDRGTDRARLAASPRTGAGAQATAELRRAQAATTSGAGG